MIYQGHKMYQIIPKHQQASHENIAWHKVFWHSTQKNHNLKTLAQRMILTLLRDVKATGGDKELFRSFFRKQCTLFRFLAYALDIHTLPHCKLSNVIFMMQLVLKITHVTWLIMFKHWNKKVLNGIPFDMIKRS